MSNYPSRPLLFVVGAGASKDFDRSMPVGTELANAIEQQLSDEFSVGGHDGPIKKALMQAKGGLSSDNSQAAIRIHWRSIFTNRR